MVLFRASAQRAMRILCLFLLSNLIATTHAFSLSGAAMPGFRAAPTMIPGAHRPILGLSRSDPPGSCQRACKHAACRIVMSAGAQGSAQTAGNAILVAAAGKAQAVDSAVQVALSKFLGYGILVGSLFLQVPQLIKILKLRSVAGISRWSRYSEVMHVLECIRQSRRVMRMCLCMNACFVPLVCVSTTRAQRACRRKAAGEGQK